MPSSDDGQYAFGHLVLRNPSEDDAVISEVSLVGAVGLRLVESVVMEIADTTLVGVQPWPPATVTNTSRWEGRAPAAGATIGARADDVNLVLHLAADVPPASLEAVRVAYELDGRHYAFDSWSTLTIRTACF